MLLIASSPDYRGRRPTAEIMAKIAYCGVASWLRSGTTDVTTLLLHRQGEEEGGVTGVVATLKGILMDLRIKKLKF